MVCPVCDAPDSRVVRTAKGKTTSRERQCDCGAAWWTLETVSRKSIRRFQGCPRVPIAPDVIAFVLERDGHRCRYCGTDEATLGVDHIIPLCAAVPTDTTLAAETAARNHPDNLCACCRRCNFAKGDRVNGKRMGPCYSTQPIAANSRPVATGSKSPLGDLGGPGLSGVVGLPLSDPDSSSVVSKQETTRRGRRNVNDYTEDFEVFWQGCVDGGRGKGNKFPAFKAWVKFNTDPNLTHARWNLWMTTPQWSGGKNPDVSSWINARGFEREPSEFELRPRNGTAPDVRKGWAPPATAAEHKGGKVEW